MKTVFTNEKIFQFLKNLISLSVFIYIIGYFIIINYLIYYGISDIDIFKVSYLTAGFSFFIPFASFFTIIYLFENNKFLNKIKYASLIWLGLMLTIFLTIESYDRTYETDTIKFVIVKYPFYIILFLIPFSFFRYNFIDKFISKILNLLTKNICRKTKKEIKKTNLFTFPTMNSYFKAFVLFIPVLLFLLSMRGHNLHKFLTGVYVFSILLFIMLLLKLHKNDKVKKSKIYVTFALGIFFFSYWYGTQIYKNIRMDFGGGEAFKVSFLIKNDYKDMVYEMEKSLLPSKEYKKIIENSYMSNVNYYQTQDFIVLYQNETNYYLYVKDDPVIIYSFPKEYIFCNSFNMEEPHKLKTRNYFDKLIKKSL